MLKVGMPKENTYSKVEFDKDGWADASKFIPRDFDLCELKLKDRKARPGWALGPNWDGLNMKPEFEVLYWKIFKEKDCHAL